MTSTFDNDIYRHSHLQCAFNWEVLKIVLPFNYGGRAQAHTLTFCRTAPFNTWEQLLFAVNAQSTWANVYCMINYVLRGNCFTKYNVGASFQSDFQLVLFLVVALVVISLDSRSNCTAFRTQLITGHMSSETWIWFTFWNLSNVALNISHGNIWCERYSEAQGFN